MEFLYEETEYAQHNPYQTIILEYINVHLYEGIVNEMNVGIDGRRISNRTEILRTF